MAIALLLLLCILSLFLTAMIAAYGTLSTSHLRHWAKKKDPAASKLYPLKARGSAALLTLELIRALLFGAFIALLAANFSLWLVWLIIVVVLFGAFALITQLYLKSFGVQLLIWLSAPVLMVTHWLRPVMLPLGRKLDKFLSEEPATVTRSDLRNSLKQVAAEDTDLSAQEIETLQNVLRFNKKTVHDVMLPKRKLSLISINEVLAPVVLDELHSSNQDYFPVMAPDTKTVVGILAMADIMDINHNPSVAETMRRAQFINEDQTLEDAINQYYATKQPVFITQNGAGNIAGLLSMDMVLKELLAAPPPEIEDNLETDVATDEPTEVVDQSSEKDLSDQENSEATITEENTPEDVDTEQIAESDVAMVE